MTNEEILQKEIDIAAKLLADVGRCPFEDFRCADCFFNEGIELTCDNKDKWKEFLEMKVRCEA